MIGILPNWHPIFVHFTVALYAASAALFLAAYLFAARPWSGACLAAAYWNLWLGAGVTTATVAAGLYAFATVPHDEAAHLVIADHRNWALATAAAWWGLAAWAARGWARDRSVRVRFLGALVVSLSLLAVTAWKGGELVYRHGIGVLAPSQAPSMDELSGGKHH